MTTTVFGYLHQGISVEFCIPSRDYSESALEFITGLSNLGAKILVVEKDEPLVLQAGCSDRIVSIATPDDAARIPGSTWLDSLCVVVESKAKLLESFKLFEFRKVSSEFIGTDTKIIEVTKQLNVKLEKFGVKFWAHLFGEFPELQRVMSSETIESVSYVDRYLQSPSSILMIGQILGCLKQLKINSLDVKTLLIDSSRPSHLISHDWTDIELFRSVAGSWLRSKSGLDEECLSVGTDRRAQERRRLLTLNMSSGDRVLIRLDQGVGYWKLDCKNGLHFYRHDDSLEEQILHLKKVVGSACVVNTSDWPTDISVYIQKK